MYITHPYAMNVFSAAIMLVTNGTGPVLIIRKVGDYFFASKLQTEPPPDPDYPSFPPILSRFGSRSIHLCPIIIRRPL